MSGINQSSSNTAMCDYRIGVILEHMKYLMEDEGLYVSLGGLDGTNDGRDIEHRARLLHAYAGLFDAWHSEADTADISECVDDCRSALALLLADVRHPDRQEWAPHLQRFTPTPDGGGQ